MSVREAISANDSYGSLRSNQSYHSITSCLYYPNNNLTSIANYESMCDDSTKVIPSLISRTNSYLSNNNNNGCCNDKHSAFGACERRFCLNCSTSAVNRLSDADVRLRRRAVVPSTPHACHSRCSYLRLDDNRCSANHSDVANKHCFVKRPKKKPLQDYYNDDDAELEALAKQVDPSAPKPEGAIMSPARCEALRNHSDQPSSLEAALQRNGTSCSRNPCCSVLDQTARPSTPLTYGKLLSRANKLAYALLNKTANKNDSGLKPGDRVALVYPNNDPLSFICAFYGCVLAGIVPVPIEVPFTKRDAGLQAVGFLLGSCSVRMALTSEACLKGLPKSTAGDVIEFKDVFITRHRFEAAGNASHRSKVLPTANQSASESIPDVNAIRDFLTNIYSTEWAVSLSILYALITIFGAVGNTLVILVVLRNRAMWSARNVLIVNLAFADFVLSVMIIPFVWLPEYWVEYRYGTTLCKITSGVFNTNIFCSSLTIVAISADRYFTVTRVRKHQRFTTLHTCGVATAIWLLSMSFCLPFFILYHLKEWQIPELYGNTTLIRTCSLDADFRLRLGLNSLQFIFLYPFPLCLVVVFNYQLHGFLAREGRRKRVFQSSNQHKMHRRFRSRTSRLLVAMALSYAICWLPYTLLYFITESYPEMFGQNVHIFRKLHQVFQVVAYSSLSVNPFLYGYLNTNFKREFLRVWRDLKTGRIESFICCLPDHSELIRIAVNGELNLSDKDNLSQNVNLTSHNNSYKDDVSITYCPSPTEPPCTSVIVSQDVVQPMPSCDVCQNKLHNHNDIGQTSSSLASCKEEDDDNESKLNLLRVDSNCTTGSMLSTSPCSCIGNVQLHLSPDSASLCIANTIFNASSREDLEQSLDCDDSDIIWKMENITYV